MCHARFQQLSEAGESSEPQTNSRKERDTERESEDETHAKIRLCAYLATLKDGISEPGFQMEARWLSSFRLIEFVGAHSSHPQSWLAAVFYDVDFNLRRFVASTGLSSRPFLSCRSLCLKLG